MKKTFAFVLAMAILTTCVKAQSTPQTQATQLAQKLKDSLSLSEQQKVQVETATLEVQNKKANLRQLYKGKALEYYLLMAEDSRDTLYKNLLPPDKYLLFRQKKSNLLSSF